MKVGKITLITVLAVALSISVGYIYSSFAVSSKSEAPTVTSVEVIQDPKLVNDLHAVGVGNAPKDLTIKYDPELSTGPYDGEYNLRTITIKPGLPDSTEKREVAHEYLHYVWYTGMSNHQKALLSDQLDALAKNDTGLRVRLGKDKYNYRPTELFSYYCTESSDQWLTKTVITACQKYIDRSKLVMLR